MKDDVHFMQLWDLYSPLLTATQKEITDLYFNYDLSLAEIAEEKGVTRQSVSDCLQKCRKQLEKYEEKLGFLQTLNDLSREYSSYMTAVERFIAAHKGENAEVAALKSKLDEIHEAFQNEIIDLDGQGEIVGHYGNR